MTTSNNGGTNGRRVAVIDGVRTPFLRAGTDFSELKAYDLGRYAVAGLMNKTGVDPRLIQELTYGVVIPDPMMANVAREVCLGAGLPASTRCHTVSVACISANQAITAVADQIARGYADAGVAGGCETLSDVPIRYGKKMRRKFMVAQKARTWRDKFNLYKDVRPADFAPDMFTVMENSTGLSMGETGERLAKRLGISRAAQDEFAVRSHRRAAAAFEQGLFAEEVLAVAPPPKYQPVARDNGVRGDTTVEKMAKLRPAFDPNYGSVTAGNASFFTDGASAVLLMSEERAAALGLKPKAFIRSYAYAGTDPLEELLLGPAYAIPTALDRAGLALPDVGVFEIHEAFAVQALAVLQLLASPTFAREKFGRDAAFGEIDPDKLNAHGGSLSLGHPFGATGGRLLTTCVNRMIREDAQFGVIAACGAGGCGNATVLERAN